MERKIPGLDNAMFAGRVRSYRPRQATYTERSVTNPAQAKASLPLPVESQGLAGRVPQQNAYSVQKSTGYAIDGVQREANNIPAHRNNTRNTTHATPIISPLNTSSTDTVDTRPRAEATGISFRKHALPAFAVMLFLIGVGVSVQTLIVNKNTASTVQAMGESSQPHTADGITTETPDETEPSSGDVSGYRVATDLPRVVRINKIGLNARIKRIGVDNKNQLKAPANVFDVGWYDGSNKPGEGGGAAILAAHVSGPTKRGAFYNLKKLVAGDVIEVERGDGKKVQYTVVRSQAYPKDSVDMASMFVSAEEGKQGLNLITCSGDLSGTDYQERLIVYAVEN